MSMLRGVNPLLRSSLSPISTLRTSPIQPAFTPRFASSRSVLQRPRIAGPGLLPPIWSSKFATKPPVQPTKIDKENEKKIAQKKIEPDPEHVSSTSTVRPLFGSEDETARPTTKGEPDVMEGVKTDLNTVAETFSLKAVPRETLALGLAGTLPYLATSLSTMYLAWDLNATASSSSFINSLMVSHETASHWLHLLEPIQLGYGAIIISFLGAVHWGLEFAEKSPSRPRTNFRHGLGVLAPAVAWPTLLLPVEWALVGQFAAFAGLYFADSRATVRGWAPPWYATYRFVLTLVVGSAIFVSIVGRTKIGQSKESAAARLKEQTATRNAEPAEGWEKLEMVEKEKEAIKKREEEQKKDKRKKEAENKVESKDGDEGLKDKTSEVKTSEGKTAEGGS